MSSYALTEFSIAHFEISFLNRQNCHRNTKVFYLTSISFLTDYKFEMCYCQFFPTTGIHSRCPKKDHGSPHAGVQYRNSIPDYQHLLQPADAREPHLLEYNSRRGVCVDFYKINTDHTVPAFELHRQHVSKVARDGACAD